MYTRIVMAVGLLIAAGWLHGRWVDRWGSSQEIADAAAVFPNLPMICGEWEGRDITSEESPFAYRSQSPQLMRRYSNRLNGNAVCLLLTCGRPSCMIIEHTPKTCYNSLGYEEFGQGRRQSIALDNNGQAELFAHTFVKVTPAYTSRIRLYWSWGVRDSWSFPERPRLEFASKPVLYKLYVTREMISDEERIEDEPIVPFLKALIPELNRTIAN